MAAPPENSRIPPVTSAEVYRARELLHGVIRTTPVAGARALSDAAGTPVHLKCENLQRTGSFKIRGAYTRIARLSPDERAGGVVAASAGNHAQGVALAARLLGVRATVFMPERAALPKVDATRGYGARVVLTGRTVDEAVAAAVAAAEESGAVFVHPFDHPDIIAGQGTVGCEILEQVPDPGTVLVSAGCSAVSPRCCVSTGRGPGSSGYRRPGPRRGRRHWPRGRRSRSAACGRWPTASPSDVRGT